MIPKNKTDLYSLFQRDTGLAVIRHRYYNERIFNEDVYKEYVKWLEEQLIEALIRKHKECRDIAKNCVIPAVIKQSEQLKCLHEWKSIGHQFNGHQECIKCGKTKAF